MEKPLRTFASFRFAALLALVLLAASATCWAQSADFAVSQNGKSVGTASFKFAANSEGYDSTSVVRVSMQGLEYQLSKTEKLSSANLLQHVQLSAIVNSTAVNIAAKPDSGQILINISANGRSSTTRLDGHKFVVFLADFDPGALQTLLTLAVANNNRDLWAIVPKQAGQFSPFNSPHTLISRARSTANQSPSITSSPRSLIRPRIFSPAQKTSFSRPNFHRKASP